ncbi:MAG: hypothetical protein F6K14_10060 [Symploca sp. SIO2C1]|nr:hypothetical protein [Symploca sp. SIO2C1]
MLTELAIALFQQQRITLGTTSKITGLHHIKLNSCHFGEGLDESVCVVHDLQLLHPEKSFGSSIS